MEQTMEIRVRRVTRNGYDVVALRDGEVSVMHGATLAYAKHWVEAQFGSKVYDLKVGGSVNFKSEVKFM